MLIRYESDDGETVEVIPRHFKPLLYADLLPNSTKDDKAYSIELVGDSIDVTNNGIQSKKPVKVTTQIAFREPPTVYALVEGGWLPPPFVRPPYLLVDRNVISSLKRIAEGFSRPDLKSRDWWFRFFDNKELVINPLLYALEGNRRRPPLFDEFRNAFNEASLDVLKCLPKAKVVKYKSKHFQAAYSILTDLAARTERETEFLLRTVPLIVTRVADSRLTEIQSNIFQIAESLKLTSGSLAVLAVLSCLYENRDGSGFLTARRILKPQSHYTAPAAHNTLADLRSLELCIVSRGAVQAPYALCTCDRALALFWCGIKPHGVEWKDGTVKFNLSIDEYLFPRLPTVAREELVEKFFS
jgi:hypothetical protein